MKTLKLVFLILAVAIFSSGNLHGQPLKMKILVTIGGIDYGPGIGFVTGTYSYQVSLFLDDDGKLESMHWHVVSCNLVNDKGDKVKIVDSGVDTYGATWDFFNNAAFYNTGYDICYETPDGWMDDYLPDDMFFEGKTVSMSTKVICKGTSIDWCFMVQLHRNSHDEITANVVKSCI